MFTHARPPPPQDGLLRSELPTADPSAFRLGHLRAGTVSLALAENDEDEGVRLRPGYVNVEFTITTGAGGGKARGVHVTARRRRRC